MPHEIVVGGTESGKSTLVRSRIRSLYYENRERAEELVGSQDFSVVWLDPQWGKSAWEFYQDLLGLGLDDRVIFESLGETDTVIPF